MAEGFLTNEAAGPRRGVLLLAHGAGAAMDSPFMNRFAGHAAAAGLEVARFEFAYMAQRRTGGSKRPPAAVETLVVEFRKALTRLLAVTDGPVIIGGKSLGGRVAAMVGGGALDPRVVGVLCLGYPLHPPGMPEKQRLEPLAGLAVPALICQGERDPFGDRREIEAMVLPPAVRLHWCTDGSHDLAPRGGSPATWDGNLKDAAEAAATLLSSPAA